MKKLRLLVTKKCQRNCVGCCNKDWDLDALPIADHFNYDEILITGGEPLSDDNIDRTLKVIDGIDLLHYNKDRKKYIYTADSFGVHSAFFIADGFTLTIHNKNDLREFRWLVDAIAEEDLIKQFIKLKGYSPSLRLNVFKGITIPEYWNLEDWTVKDNLEWIKECPLPTDEVFMRLSNID